MPPTVKDMGSKLSHTKLKVLSYDSPFQNPFSMDILF